MQRDIHHEIDRLAPHWHRIVRRPEEAGMDAHLISFGAQVEEPVEKTIFAE